MDKRGVVLVAEWLALPAVAVVGWKIGASFAHVTGRPHMPNLAWWEWAIGGFVGFVCAGIVVLAWAMCMAMSDKRDPHAIPRSENPWTNSVSMPPRSRSEHTSGVLE